MDEVNIGEFSRRSRLSVKALRLYDELGVLVPARVDEASGYRFYNAAQLDAARLVAMLRQLDLPLASVKEMLDCEPAEAAQRIRAYWAESEAAHTSRRDLANYLVDLLNRKRSSTMFEVATREMPPRSLLCLKRNVDEQGAWALGKEFVAIMRHGSLPKLDGRQGAAFSIYWGQVNADSDGPIEWCRPVPDAQAKELVEQFPELTLRVEPAHQEAFVALPAGAEWDQAQWQLASEALHSWAAENGIVRERLELTPEDLGSRITYLANAPITKTSVPDRDFAVPFAIAATTA
jgi:DNA-binding transcriptional MerR regulator